MKLLIDRITDAPTAFDFEIPSEGWHGPESPRAEEVLVSPLRFELRVHRMAEDIYLEGTAAGTFELGCSRCLARYRHALQESFRLVLEPAGSRRPPDPEGAEALERSGLYLSDELETGWFQGDEVDLGEFLREVVALALPLKPLCREDCQGLCPQCGVDRNVAACECEEARPDSPFAALRSLRVGQTGDA